MLLDFLQQVQRNNAPLLTENKIQTFGERSWSDGAECSEVESRVVGPGAERWNVEERGSMGQHGSRWMDGWI